MKTDSFQTLPRAASKAMMLIVACVTLVLGGCIIDVDGGVAEPGAVRVELFTRTPDYTPPVVTRIGMADENTIETTPFVAVFRTDNGMFVELAQATQAGGQRFVVLKPRSFACTALVLANLRHFTDPDNPYTIKSPTPGVLSPLLSGKTLDQISELLHTRSIEPWDGVPYTVSTQLLPMSEIYPLPGGIGSGTKIGTATAPLQLRRVVAKVVVEANAPDFALQGAAVGSTPKRGLLYRDATAPLKTWLGTYDRVNYEGITPDNITGIAIAKDKGGIQTTEDDPIYLYESSAAEGMRHTSLIIQGRYKGTKYYYKLGFLKPFDGSVLDIVRNKIYTFKITKVEKAGFSSSGEAFASKSYSNGIVGEMKVTDAYAHNIQDNRGYYLGLSNTSYMMMSQDPQTNKLAFVITTNCTDSSLFNQIRVSSGKGWLTIASPANGKISLTGPTEVRVDMTSASGLFTWINNSTGHIQVQLGDLSFTVPIEKGMKIPSQGTARSSSLTLPDQLRPLKATSGESETCNWIKFSRGATSADGPLQGRIDNDPANPDPVFIHILPNKSGAYRENVVYLFHGSGHRDKIEIGQEG